VSNEVGQATHFLLRQTPPSRRNPIIASPRAVVVGTCPFVHFFDQAIVKHSPDGPVQRPGAQPHSTVSTRGDLLHDGVSVTFAVPERHENLENR
jgi:hypothetical protein